MENLIVVTELEWAVRAEMVRRRRQAQIANAELARFVAQRLLDREYK